MSINKIVAALDDYTEARMELEQRKAEYTGYSPSYALHFWKEVLDKAKDRLAAALDEYIDDRIRVNDSKSSVA